MPNIWKTKNWFKDPATIKLGTVDATEVAEIITGTVSLDLPAIGTVGISAASASVVGLTANHRVIVGFQEAAVTDAPSMIVAAIGIAGGFQVTAYNTQTASINATARNVQYFAWR